MHQTWRRQTPSKNTLLINSRGKCADKEKSRAKLAKGKTLAAEERKQNIDIHGDATAAYRSLSPAVKRTHCEIQFVSNAFFVIVNSVDAETLVTVEFLLEVNDPYRTGARSFHSNGERAGFYGEFFLVRRRRPGACPENLFSWRRSLGT